MDGFWDADESANNGGLPPLPPELDPRGKHRGARRAAKSGAASRESAGRTPPAAARTSPPSAGRSATAARKSIPASSILATTGRSTARSSGRAVTRVLAAMLSAFLVGYIGFLWSKVHGVDQKITHITINSLGGVTSNGQSRYDIDGKDENLIIVGNDDRSDLTSAERNLLHTGSDVSLSTDTMMIVHVPADGSKATLISLPRDSYVSIPGHGMNKLNTAYADGYNTSSGTKDSKRAAGANLLVQTVENLTGLNIDHYVQVGLIGFYRIAKAIHGVPVNLCKAVDDTTAHNLATGQDGGSGFKMTAGTHVLTAVEALEFVRQRHNLTNGDIDRTARQRYFLTAAFRKIASAGVLLNPGKLGDLVDAVDKSLYVDSGLKILDLAKQMANLSANNITGKAIPFERFWNDSPVGSVEVVDPAKVKSFVKKLINSSNSAYTKAKVGDPASVTVSVVNAGAANKAATTASKVLSGAGFKSTVGAGAGTQASTVIEYASGMESQAKTLAAYVPGASVQLGNVTTLTLQLGSDHVTAKSKPASAKPTSTSTSTSSSKTKSPKALDAGCIN